MEARFVYITCKDRAEAIMLGKRLVEARLAACANVIDGMHSLYWWEGEVVEDQETILILKSRSELIQALTSMVQDLHSYDLPCVIALPIAEGSQPYLQWIQQETT